MKFFNVRKNKASLTLFFSEATMQLELRLILGGESGSPSIQEQLLLFTD